MSPGQNSQVSLHLFGCTHPGMYLSHYFILCSLHSVISLGASIFTPGSLFHLGRPVILKHHAFRIVSLLKESWVLPAAHGIKSKPFFLVFQVFLFSVSISIIILEIDLTFQEVHPSGLLSTSLVNLASKCGTAAQVVVKGLDVCACMCTCVWAGVCVYMCEHMWRTEINFTNLPLSLSTLVFAMVSLTVPGAC